MHDPPQVAVVDGGEDLLHDVCRLPIVDASLLHYKAEKFTARTKLRHYVIVVVVHVTLVVFQYMRVVDALQHSDLIGEIGLTGDITFLDDFKRPIFIEIPVKDSLDTAE